MTFSKIKELEININVAFECLHVKAIKYDATDGNDRVRELMFKFREVYRKHTKK